MYINCLLYFLKFFIFTYNLHTYYYLVLIINRVCFKVQLPNVATIPEVIINEAKTTTRDLNAEDQVQEKQWDGGNEDNAPRINAPTTAITHSEQKSTVDNVTTNVARVSTKMSPFVN